MCFSRFAAPSRVPCGGCRRLFATPMQFSGGALVRVSRGGFRCQSTQFSRHLWPFSISLAVFPSRPLLPSDEETVAFFFLLQQHFRFE